MMSQLTNMSEGTQHHPPARAAAPTGTDSTDRRSSVRPGTIGRGPTKRQSCKTCLGKCCIGHCRF